MRWFILLVAIGLGATFLYVYSQIETYCFFYPSIDTIYAPGFSEKKLATLQTGDAAEKVQAVLGQPLFRRVEKGGIERWAYSADGKCHGWADFAWLARWVSVSNGVVVEIGSRVFYD